MSGPTPAGVAPRVCSAGVRIALFTEVFLPKIDGITNRLRHTLPCLEAEGHECLLFAPDTALPAFGATRVVRIPSLPFPRYPGVRVSLPDPRIAASLASFRPDLVHAVGPGVSHLEAGDEVVVAPGTSCGHCAACLSGRDHHCRSYAILGEHRHGATAELVLVPAVNAVPKPASLSFEQAAAVGVAQLTAWHMLSARAEVRPGETVLVQGAGSGVGTAAIQIARHLGARVLAATHSPAKAPALRALGADEVLVPGRERLHQRVQKLTGRRGADVVFEHVGAASWDESVRSAAYRGRIVTCGATSGALAQTNLAFVFAKELAIHGATLGSREDLAAVLDLVQQGRLQPVVDRVLPLAECRTGHEILESGRANGKIVLRVP